MSSRRVACGWCSTKGRASGKPSLKRASLDDGARLVPAPQPDEQNAKPLAVFDCLEGLLTGHALVPYDANRLDMQRLLQAVDDPDRRLQVRDVARSRLSASITDADDHLRRVGAVIRMVPPTNRLSAGTLEIDRRRVRRIPIPASG
jgi:hypothetical protein